MLKKVRSFIIRKLGGVDQPVADALGQIARKATVENVILKAHLRALQQELKDVTEAKKYPVQ